MDSTRIGPNVGVSQRTSENGELYLVGALLASAGRFYLLIAENNNSACNPKLRRLIDA